MKPQDPKESEFIESLKSIRLFAQVEDELFEAISPKLECVMLADGEILCREGDPCESMYILIDGKLKAFIGDGDARRLMVGEIEPGQPVGELQMMIGGMRTANVSAEGECRLVRAPREVFETIAARSPETIGKLMEFIWHRLLRNQLASLLPDLFGEMNEKMYRDIESNAEWIHLGRGNVLFRQGDPGDCLFILVHGRLQAVVEDKFGKKRVIGEIARGENVGEMGVFTGEPRTATVTAIRDSLLLRFSREAFEKIGLEYPRVYMGMTRTIVERLRRVMGSYAADAGVSNIVLVPARADVDLESFAIRLRNQLAAYGAALHLSPERFDSLLGASGIAQTPVDVPYNLRLSAWLDSQETKYRFVLFQADPGLTHWTRRCVRHSDVVVVVADANADPSPGETEAHLQRRSREITSARQILVLLHPDGKKPPSGTKRWLSRRQLQSHHHVRLDRDEDFARLARYLTGNAVGVVLGGGGARGFAHIGVLHALKDKGVPVDLVGGTSMGGAIASQFALGWNYDTMLRINRKEFVDKDPFSKYTVPFISLLEPSAMEKIMRGVYKDKTIEDLWTSYFCISSNLTSSEMQIHRTGLLSEALLATTALPGICAPVIQDKSLLIDGSILNNMPCDVMRRLGAGRVIAVDVSSDEDLSVDYDSLPTGWQMLSRKILRKKTQSAVPNILDILMRSTVLYSVHKMEQSRRDADLYIRPPVEQVGLLEFDGLEKLAEIGYRHTVPIAREWLEGARAEG